MDLRRLGYFLAVAEESSFTKAARSVHVAQPSLSQAVRELEAELGTELFHRLGRQVVLSPAGRALLEPARQAQRDVEVGRQAVASVAGLAGGSLEVCALPTLAADPLASIVGRFRRAHPRVRVSVAGPDTPIALHEMVRSGQCELGLTAMADAFPGLEHHELKGRQELVAVLPPGMRPSTITLSIKRLARLPLVVSAPGTSSRDLLDEALAEAGLEAEVAVTAAARDAMVPLVLAGAGVAVLPRPVAETARRAGAVVAQIRPRLTRLLALVHRRGPLSPSAARFLELLPLRAVGATTSVMRRPPGGPHQARS